MFNVAYMREREMLNVAYMRERDVECCLYEGGRC